MSYMMEAPQISWKKKNRDLATMSYTALLSFSDS